MGIEFHFLMRLLYATEQGLNPLEPRLFGLNYDVIEQAEPIRTLLFVG